MNSGQSKPNLHSRQKEAPTNELIKHTRRGLRAWVRNHGARNSSTSSRTRGEPPQKAATRQACSGNKPRPRFSQQETLAHGGQLTHSHRGSEKKASSRPVAHALSTSQAKGLRNDQTQHPEMTLLLNIERKLQGETRVILYSLESDVCKLITAYQQTNKARNRESGTGTHPPGRAPRPSLAQIPAGGDPRDCTAGRSSRKQRGLCLRRRFKMHICSTGSPTPDSA